MYLILFLIILGRSCISKEYETEWDRIWDAMLERDLSPNTYYSLKNISVDKNVDYKFDYNAMQHLYRRYTVYETQKPWHMQVHWATYRKDMEDLFGLYTCRAQNAMYQAAIREIRKFFPMRLLYMDNLEFEVGYVVYQVVHRYQMMVELYGLAYRKYYMHQDDARAAGKYMLYVYRSMLKLSNVIIHLSNMAHEMERKFEGHETIFTHTEPPERIHGTGTKKQKTKTAAIEGPDGAANAMAVINRIQEMERLKKKAQKKEKKRQMIEGMVKYVPKGEPERSKRYRYIYGWSIEDWWI